MKNILLLLALIFCGLFADAQSTPKYSNEFLSIGVGARAFGMSNSMVASADDVTAAYWNPAGLTRQKDKIQFSFMHSAYLAGIANYDYLGLSAKVKDNAAIAFSMVRFGVDGIPYTHDLIQNGQINYDRVREFSAIDYGFLLSYAQTTGIEGLSFGGSAKIIHRSAGDFTTAWGFGIDAGVQYSSVNDWLFAAMVRDATSTFNAWSFNFTDAEKTVFVETGNTIPSNSLEITLPKILLGVAKKFEFGEDYSLLGEFDLDINTDGKRNTLIKSNFISADPHLGLEGSYNDIIFVRAGIGNFQQETTIDQEKQWSFQPNIGLGLNLGRLTVDYALSDIGDQSAALYSHVFSIRASINASN